MNYGEVLSRAWAILWKYKVLWIFGILAACGSALRSNGSNSGFRYDFNGPAPAWLQPYLNQFQGLPNWQIFSIAGVILLLSLAIFVLFIVLGTVGEIGLIRGTQKADQNLPALTFSELWRESFGFFWRVLGLNLLAGIVVIALILILVLFFIGALVVFPPLIICLLPLVCLLIPAIVIINLIRGLSVLAIVIEDLGISAGISRGLEVLRTHIGPILIMGIILFIGVELIVGSLIALPFTALAAALFFALYQGFQNQALGGGTAILFVLGLIYLPIMIFLYGLLRTYENSAWALTYLRLTRPRSIVPEGGTQEL